LTNTSDANYILKVIDMSTSKLVIVLSQSCFSKPILRVLSRLWCQMMMIIIIIISCIFIRRMRGMFVCNKILVFNCRSEEQHSCKGCTFMFISSFVVYVGMHERPTTLVMHKKRSHLLGLDFPTLPPSSSSTTTPSHAYEISQNSKVKSYC